MRPPKPGTKKSKNKNKKKRIGREALSSKVVLKQGDDLRQDAAVQQVFKFFNYLWRNQNLNYQGCPIEIFTYKCVPLGDKIGVIEYIPNCQPLRNAAVLDKKLTPEQTKH